MENKILDIIIYYYTDDNEDPILFNYSAYDLYSKFETLFEELKKEIKINLESDNEDKMEYLSSFDKKLFRFYSDFKYRRSEHFYSLNKLNGEITIDSSLLPLLESQLCISSNSINDALCYERQKEFFEFVKNHHLSNLFVFIKKTKKQLSLVENENQIKRIKMSNVAESLNAIEKLIWIGKPSQLGFIISKLAELGYIEAPKRKNSDVNYSQFSKLVKNTFDIDTTEGTLSKYLNLDSEKGQETERNFNKNGFNMPDRGIIS